MNHTEIYYQGHASLRLTTPEGKIIYVDPYAGDGYDRPADLILVSHEHSDHNAVDKVEKRNPGCRVIRAQDALVQGRYQTFELPFGKVEAVAAGNNRNHDIRRCVGWLLTMSDGKTVYLSGDTSTTDQMKELAGRSLDVAFFCCDGVYNMDAAEASRCAALVTAKLSLPYHTVSDGRLYDPVNAARFTAPKVKRLQPGETLTL